MAGSLDNIHKNIPRDRGLRLSSAQHAFSPFPIGSNVVLLYTYTIILDVYYIQSPLCLLLPSSCFRSFPYQDTHRAIVSYLFEQDDDREREAGTCNPSWSQPNLNPLHPFFILSLGRQPAYQSEDLACKTTGITNWKETLRQTVERVCVPSKSRASV